MPDLALIVAIARNGVIGRGGQLPWSFPEDRARYEATTRGHAVVMGRCTWEEVGEPLEGRVNVVVSPSLAARGGLPAGVHVVPDLGAALAVAWAHDPCPFLLGGVRLFEEALPQVTRVYLTEVPGSPAGDTFFRLDETPFREVSREVTASGLVFRVLERLQPASGVRI
jgi:dihydrofolate reductase